MLGFLPNRRHSSGGAFFRLSDLLRIPSVNCRLWMVSAHSLCRPDHSWHLPRNLGLKLPTVRTECISVFSVIGFLQACSRQSFTVWSPASLHPVGSPALSPPRSDHTPVGSWCFWRPCQPPTRRGLSHLLQVHVVATRRHHSSCSHQRSPLPCGFSRLENSLRSGKRSWAAKFCFACTSWTVHYFPAFELVQAFRWSSSKLPTACLQSEDPRAPRALQLLF